MFQEYAITMLEFLKIAILNICFPILVTFTYFLLGYNIISDFRDATISDATNGTRYHAMNFARYHATDNLSYNTTDGTNNNTVDGTSYNATDDTSYNALDGASYHATYAASYHATDVANYYATDDPSYNTTNGSNYHTKYGANYNAMDSTSYNATDDSNYHALNGASYNAKDGASYHSKDGVSYNARDGARYYAMVGTICDAMSNILYDASVLCGIAIFFTNWLPSFFCQVHLGTNVRSNGLLLFIFVAFFPVIPTVLYMHLLCQRKATEEERETYKSLKKTAHEMRSTAEAIQSSTLLTIVIYLMHQGILATPWNDPIVSFQDHYRNIAYLPSLSVVSIAFPTICILRTLIYLNYTSKST